MLRLWQLVSEFDEPCAVAVKHNNPCGLAVGDNLCEAYLKAYEGDPVSIFGGIVACNRKVDLRTAKAMSKIFLEVIIAPEFSEEALAVLTKKANLRLLKLAPAASAELDWKKVSGGFLVQEADSVDLDRNQLKVVTNRRQLPIKNGRICFWLESSEIRKIKCNCAVQGQAVNRCWCRSNEPRAVGTLKHRTGW